MSDEKPLFSIYKQGEETAIELNCKNLDDVLTVSFAILKAMGSNAALRCTTQLILDKKLGDKEFLKEMVGKEVPDSVLKVPVFKQNDLKN